MERRRLGTMVLNAGDDTRLLGPFFLILCSFFGLEVVCRIRHSGNSIDTRDGEMEGGEALVLEEDISC